jgi:hypothetical protein
VQKTCSDCKGGPFPKFSRHNRWPQPWIQVGAVTKARTAWRENCPRRQFCFIIPFFSVPLFYSPTSFIYPVSLSLLIFFFFSSFFSFPHQTVC